MSVEESSGVRFYTATLAPDERLKSAGKGRVPPRTSLPSAGATRSQGGDHMQCFPSCEQGKQQTYYLNACSRHILCRSLSTPALGAYSIGPPRLLLSGHTPSVPLDPCSRDILYWSPSTRGKDKRICVQGGTRGYIDYPPSLRAPSHSFPPIKSKIW